MALVGEPTGMQAAVRRTGAGSPGLRRRAAKAAMRRAARVVNALYIALDDIARLRSFRFERESELLGPIGIAVTQIEAGHAAQRRARHLPLRRRSCARRTPTPTRRRSKSCAAATPLRRRAPFDAHPGLGARTPHIPLARGLPGPPDAPTYVSPTTSDMALMPFPSLKMGPGQSSRSHTADEFVLLDGDRGGNRRLRKLHRKISFGIWQNFGIRGSNPTR